MNRQLFTGLVLVASLLLAGCRKNSEPSSPALKAMNRGVSFMGQYQYEDAVQAFQKALQAQPALTEAKVNLAIALFNRNRKEDIEAAGKLLDEALQKEPGNGRALYFKAIIFQHIGKADAAVPLLEKVAKQYPNDGAIWYVLGLCRSRIGQPAEADFRRAIQLRPYLYSAYYQLYQIMMRSGKAEEAKSYLDTFKKLREAPLGESIELPQYNQMGDLALARPLAASMAPKATDSRFTLREQKTLSTWREESKPEQQAVLTGVAAADVDGDGLADLALPLGSPGALVLLRQEKGGGFADVTAAAGLGDITNAVSCAFGDFDNDEATDLLIATTSALRLFKRNKSGSFVEVTASANLSGTAGPMNSAIFLDADHDADLDIFACVGGGDQLWLNSGDTNFLNVATNAPLNTPAAGSVLVVPGDIDGDRDIDLIVLRDGQPVRILLNQLFGVFAEAKTGTLDARGEAGAVLQDFNGDGSLDLLVLGGNPRELKLFSGDGHAGFKASDGIAQAARSAASRGPLRGFRVADVDLDGDLDVVALGTDLHLLLNDGTGRLVLQENLWRPAAGSSVLGMELLDVDGDFVPDLLVVAAGPTNRVLLVKGELSPPGNGLAVLPSGVRSRDGRTRSPSTPFGLSLLARAGMREQRLVYSGQSGGSCQSALPLIFGLGGHTKADYVSLAWPDGVAQMESAVSAGQVHKIAELQRKISSCPVLFTWNGTRFEFVTDFAGVGGLGYFSASGVYSQPQVLEHVKIEPGQFQARNGSYELRITEPMEESAYIDRLELLAIDHPQAYRVFPDERLAISGAPPTHDLLVAAQPLFPIAATDPQGRNCVDKLLRVDRVYAYDPPLDRRYIGFCKPHSLELDFGSKFTQLPRSARVFLFINGFIEYPYSQTVYAAAQSRVGWEPIRVDMQQSDGRWQTIVPDAGVPGGMARTMTIDLTGKIADGTGKLRLTTNLEVLYDQIFVAADMGPASVQVRKLSPSEAILRRVGFAREYSPDGHLPLLYDYELSDSTAPFHTLKGAYTRYGSVMELLRDFDDQYAILGPGDELALKFAAAGLPTVAQGWIRSFILVSHAYCKDMDLYTGTPQTLEPLPFRGMSKYPYHAGECYPQTREHQAFLRTYNTRLVE